MTLNLLRLENVTARPSSESDAFL